MVVHRRNATRAESLGEVSLALRLRSYVQEEHKFAIAACFVAMLCMEMASNAIYWFEQYTSVCTEDDCWYTGNRSDLVVMRALFFAQCAFCMVFFLCWMGSILTAKDHLGIIVSRWSFINLLTSLPHLVYFVGYLAGATWSYVELGDANGKMVAETPWSPMFLRIWNLQDLLRILFNFIFSSSLERLEAVELVASLVSTMLTFVGLFQASEAAFSTRTVDLMTSVYFIVVTFGTIGYGDVAPHNWISRLVVCVMILIAVYTFPTFFGRMGEIARSIAKAVGYASRDGRRRHVIFCGRLDSRDIKFFIFEFCGGIRRFDPTHVVVLSSEEFTPELRIFAKAPGLGKRVHLVNGTPRSWEDLERCDAKHANCIFIASSADHDAAEVDADTILSSASVHRYDCNLPQYVVMRRERNGPFIKNNNVRHILEKERLKFSLLGMGVISNGAIPLLINLIRSYDSNVKAAQATTWVEQCEWSMANEFYSFHAPAVLIGKPFLHCAFKYRTVNVIVFGVVTETGDIVLNPKGYLVEPSTKFLAIAEDNDVIEAYSALLQADPAAATASLGREFEDVIMHRAAKRHTIATWSQPVTVRTRKKNVGSVVKLVPGVHDDVLKSLQAHVVLVDLHASHRQRAISAQSKVDGELFRAKDLYNTMLAIKLQDGATPILLLSRGDIHPSFDEMWRETGYESIYFVDGCGLNMADLKDCRVHSCRGAIIFSTSEGMDEDADTMAMIVTASIGAICKELGDPSHVVNVITEIRHMESITLIPPYYTTDRMSGLAAQNFAFEPAYVTGRVICSPMLDSALYQSYFSPEVLRVVDAFIYGNGKSASISSMPVPRNCTTYQDLELQCSRLGFLPIALYRLIKDEENPSLSGHRFPFVNPAPTTQILETDHVYFLV